MEVKGKQATGFAETNVAVGLAVGKAQSRDVPRGRVLKDDALYEIALHPPDSEAALARFRAVPNGYERSSSGKKILKIVEKIKQVPAEELPALPRNDGPQRVSGPVSDLLKVLLKGVAAQNKVAARLVATSDHIEAIAADDAADVPALKGWRREIFGEKAVALKRGELWVAVDGSRLAFEPREAPPRPEKSGKRRRSRKKKSAEQTDES